MILVIDADSLVYTSALRHQIIVPTLVTMDESDDSETKSIDLEAAVNTVVNKIKRIETLVENHESTILCFTEGKSFRNYIDTEYKANRKSIIRPEGIEAIRGELKALYTVHNIPSLEADDVVCLYARKPEKYIIAAIDKDVINSNPGTYINYYEADYLTRNGNKVYRTIDIEHTSKKMADYWPFYQLMVGDSSDNVKGISRFGAVKAAKVLGSNAPRGTKLKNYEDVVQYLPSFDIDKVFNSAIEAYMKYEKLDREEATDAVIFNGNLTCMNLAYKYETGEKLPDGLGDDFLHIDLENKIIVRNFLAYVKTKV